MSYRLLHVADKSILFVMAASRIRSPSQARIAPLMTGIGPVEAAIAVTAVLAGLDAADHLPDLVVSLGSAGSRTLEQTGIYQAISVSYRDMDASAFGFEKGCTPLLDLPAEVALPLRIPEDCRGTAFHRRQCRFGRGLRTDRRRYGGNGNLCGFKSLPAFWRTARQSARYFRRQGGCEPCGRLDGISAHHRRKAVRCRRPALPCDRRWLNHPLKPCDFRKFPRFDARFRVA